MKAGDERQHVLAGILCQGIMTFVMSRATTGGTGNDMAVVLTFRNQHPATQLLTDPREKSYVTYGAAHLRGVMDLIKRKPG